MLCYGNALGCLVFLQYHANEDRFETIFSARLARGAEITSIAVDTSRGSTRIATGTWDRKLVSVFSKENKGEIEMVPKALAFDTNEERDLFIFGLYDGGLYKNGGKDSRNISKHQLGSQVGNAAVDMDRRICIVDNIQNGFDLYKMETGLFVKTFITKDAVKTHPKGVAFGDKSRLVIGGSDHGHVYIFDRKTGRILKSLRHAKRGGAETLAVHDMENGNVLIATASATSSSGPGNILVWQWKSEDKRGLASEGWTLLKVIDVLFKVVVLLAAAAYFVQQGQQMAANMARRTDDSNSEMMVEHVHQVDNRGVRRVVDHLQKMSDVGKVIDGVKRVVSTGNTHNGNDAGKTLPDLLVDARAHHGQEVNREIRIVCNL
ncbi:hypothetical protein CPB84DRAFT_1851829 [Gymnopilus junonius]|uniref:Uncharacterized protein n=1 Tax=Gymnopilus junonius TaxID=109634 RepID=A0A9P5ND67_GYMJU|nr:hypothetical protein CPB84DRAFT_1851829 [Gymnopilus junonius]